MKDQQAFERLPVIPLRGLVLFPNTVVTIDIARARSLGALKRAMDDDQRIFVVAQRDPLIERPEVKDLYSVGTMAVIRQVMPLPDQAARVLIEGTERATLTRILDDAELQQGEVSILPEQIVDITPERRALMRVCIMLAKKILDSSNENMPELISALSGEHNPDEFCDIAASGIVKSVEERQALLECQDTDVRLELLLRTLSEEAELAALDERIQHKVREYMDRSNHEYYLREQIHAIQDELGEDEDEEVSTLRKRLSESAMSSEAHERVEKELKRLARTPIQAPESTVSLNYIEYMLDLPWGKKDESKIDIRKARKVFEEDHYGMKDVKERLIEYLAVRSVSEEMKSPILCLVGPPGVGKTSIARSVARALNRKFTQMSLGGVHDEAEIRGHRRTYVGAMPGRVISSINQCGTMNPVFLLDEIDKLSRDMRGDPSAAMLEVLDPEQNHAYRDHYLEAPFDLSDVLFITTANSTATIDRALLDRMEVINVSSYTLEEKTQIAKRHLLPKQMKQHQLTKEHLRIPERTLKALIEGYTREAGVRTLERHIGKICRKVTVERIDDPAMGVVQLKPQMLKKYLGAAAYMHSKRIEGQVGVINGLAWTQVGGEVMPIEVVSFPGKGAVELTGQLGDVMKESARIARSVVRSRLGEMKLAEDYFATHDIHIHVPEGAVPKDGPSAGVALSAALLSAVVGKATNADWAVTGEITLHGRVLPIGGVKEKLLAAYRLGITHILLPSENEKNLEELDADIRNKLDIVFMDTVEDAFAHLLAEYSEWEKAV